VAKGIAVLAMVVALLPASGAVAQDQGTQDQDSNGDRRVYYSPLAPSIAQVRSAGFWQQGTKRGYFRFVVTSRGFEHVANQLFIEWIKEGHFPAATRVLTRVAVSEINNSSTLVFGAPVCVTLPQCDIIELETTNTYSGQTAVVRIRLNGIGDYEIALK